MPTALNEKQTLPPEMKPENTCFFTGHRFFAAEKLPALYRLLVRCMLDRYEEGYRYFLNGGAIGFDLFAARAITVLRQDFAMDIHLILTLPCRDQTARWSGFSGSTDYLRQYHEAKCQAEAVVYVRDFYEDGCMRERNQYMTDHSGGCIAFWNGSFKGGTAQTVRMAEQKGIPVWNLYPPLAGEA